MSALSDSINRDRIIEVKGYKTPFEKRNIKNDRVLVTKRGNRNEKSNKSQ